MNVHMRLVFRPQTNRASRGGAIENSLYTYFAPVLRFLLVRFGFLLMPLVASAQTGDRTFSLKKYGTAEGLLHRSVKSITQDRDGFLWLATPVGIQRFDGHSFIAYTKAEGLHGDAPSALVQDSRGLIWILYSISEQQRVSAIDILDPRTGLISTFAEHFGTQTGVNVHDLLLYNRVLPDSTLLFGSNGQVVTYHHRNGLAVHRMALPGDYRPFHRDPQGTLLAMRIPSDGSDRSLLLRFDPQGRPNDTLLRGDLDYVTTLGLDGAASPARAQQAYAGGIHLIARTGQDVQEHWLSPTGEVRTFTAEPLADLMHARHRMRLAGDLWLVDATVRNLGSGDPPLKAPILFDLAAHAPEVGYRIHNALIDGGGRVWLGTDFGLFRLNIQPTHFQRMLWQPSPPMGMGIRVRGMGMHGDRLHVNTEVDGYWVLRASTGSVLARDTVLANRSGLYVNGGGEVWRSRGNDVVYDRPDGQNRILCTLPALVRSFLPLGSDTLLIGTNHGLYSWTSTKGAIAIRTSGLPALESSTVVHLAQSSGALWACTNAGLFKLDAHGSPIEHWNSTSAEQRHRIPTNDVRHLHHDKEGTLWLATGDVGIVQRTPDGMVNSIGRRQGMPSQAVHAIHPDTQGHLWAPTDDGLVRYNPQTDQLRVFTAAEGLAHDEFNRHAHAAGTDGRLYFGGLNGITAFHPATLTGNEPTQATAPLLITRASQFDGDTRTIVDRTEAVRNGEPITVRPVDTFFTLGFALLGFEDPHNVLYAWRVDGIDTEWNLQHEPDLRLTSLPYGRHTLHIKAQGSTGVWSPQELHIPIVVLRPWWLRWWAIAAALLLVAATVYIVVRYRLAAAARTYAMRDRIAADLHDEVGSSLSNIAMFGELLRDHGNEQPPRVQHMLERITSNSAKALESMNDIVWNVNSRFDGSEHLLARMRAYAVQASEAKGFQLRFDTTGPMERLQLDMEQRKNVYLVLKEAVNNAAKYSACSVLDIHLHTTGRGLQLTVTDDGIGFDRATVKPDGGGNGLPNMEERARHTGGVLTIQSTPGKGTTIRFELPPVASSVLGTRRSGKNGPFVA